MPRPRHVRPSRRRLAVAAVVLVALAVSGCAAGDPRFTAEAPAGFWLGLWHGIISLVTLILSAFSDTVRMYEPHNTGGWYDLGFLMGIGMMAGGGSKANPVRRRRRREQDKEWKEVGDKVEAKIRRKIRQWAEAEPDEDWNVVEAKAEAKLKQQLRDWAESP